MNVSSVADKNPVSLCSSATGICHDPESRHIATQVVRSGTAAAPNYAEALSAESRADFIHKLKIALKELNETSIWLRVIQGSFAENSDFLSGLVAENQELCKILLASIQTARRNSQAGQEQTGPTQ